MKHKVGALVLVRGIYAEVLVDVHERCSSYEVVVFLKESFLNLAET